MLFRSVAALEGEAKRRERIGIGRESGGARGEELFDFRILALGRPFEHFELQGGLHLVFGEELELLDEDSVDLGVMKRAEGFERGFLFRRRTFREEAGEDRCRGGR